MKYLLLLIVIITCDSCICCYNKPYKEKILFNISAIMRTNSKFSFKVLIKNNDENSIALLNNFTNSLNELNPDQRWELIIKLYDSIPLLFNNQKLWKLSIPKKYDYSILKSNEQIELLFEIDFTELHIEVENKGSLGSGDAPHGTYTVQLFYIDPWKKHCYAIDSLVSNKIEIEYKE